MKSKIFAICLALTISFTACIFLSGCVEVNQTETLNTKLSEKDAVIAQKDAELSLKDTVIAQQKKEIEALKAKQDVSHKQLEQSANMMMDAFKQAMQENKQLKAELENMKK